MEDDCYFMLEADELTDRMLTVNEVAYLLHVHHSTVRRWEKMGQLRSYRFGPRSVIRFKRQDIYRPIIKRQKIVSKGS